MIDFYYWPTPNGHKVTLFLEEAGLKYDVKPVNIGDGDQFEPAFLAISPNNKMPAIVDHEPADGRGPQSVFESGAILLYLAEKTGRFLPADAPGRIEALEWLFWQMAGLGPMSGQYGHFNVYAPEKISYAIERYTKEVQRLLGVLDGRLAGRAFVTGDDYTIADIAAYTWLGNLYHGAYNGSDKFLSLDEYENVGRWVKAIDARPGAIRGRLVNTQAMPERHSAADFDKVEDRSLLDPVRKRADV